ncbi:11616_t:CDS:2, partial [Acaulospora morrowiae]
RRDLDILLQWDGNNLGGIILRGRTFYHLFQYRAAISNYNKVITIDPKNEWAFNLRALARISIGDLDQAIKDSDYALKLNPGKGYSYHFRNHIYQMTEIYCDTYQYLKAISLLSAIIDLYKKEIESGDMYYVQALIRRGWIYSILENKERSAFEDFRIVLEIDPKNYEVLTDRGNLCTRLCNFKSATKDINAAIKIKPKGYMYRNRAYLYYKIGHHDLALRDLDTSEGLESEKCMTIYRRVKRRMTCLYRGMIYHKLGEYKKSLENLDEAIKILDDDEIIISLVERASVYVSINRLEDALNDFKKAFITEPKHAYMSKAISKGIKLYGIIYNLHSQSSNTFNWISLHKQHSQIPCLTLNKLKVEIDDINELTEFEKLLSHTVDSEDNPGSLKKTYDTNDEDYLDELENEDKFLDKFEIGDDIYVDYNNSKVKILNKDSFLNLLDSARLAKENAQGCFNRQLFEQAKVLGEKLSKNHIEFAEVFRGMRIIKEKFPEILVVCEKP